MRTLAMNQTPPTPLEETVLAFWTLANLSLVTQGSWLTVPSDLAACVAGLSIDTRTLEAGQAYVALHGERFEGHDFVAQAFDQGAGLAIVDTPLAQAPEQPTLLVPNTLEALHAIASAYRDLLAAADCKVIAVAGSNGKTTTRHLIHGLLEGRMITASPADPVAAAHDVPGAERPDQWALTRLAGSQSPKSFNNAVGVPLTLLQAKANDHFVVCEIGTNHPGETATLAALVRPDAVVVTSVGREHLAFFHTLDAIAQEHADLVRALRPGGTLVVEYEAWQRMEAIAHPPANHVLVTYGRSPHAFAQLLDVTSDLQGIRFDVRMGTGREPVEGLVLPLLGEHNAVNALAGLCIAQWMRVDAIQCNLGLLNVTGVAGRLEPIALEQDVTVIHDAYNANPDSMHKALDVLADLPGIRRVAVLGDMLELGELAPDAHREIGQRLAQMTDAIGCVVLVGQLSLFIAQAMGDAWPVDRVHTLGPWTDQTPDLVATLLEPGDTVLLKASRELALERLLPAITSRFGQEV